MVIVCNLMLLAVDSFSLLLFAHKQFFCIKQKGETTLETTIEYIKCEICMQQLDYGQTVTNQVFVQFLMLQSLETGTRISITLCFTYGCTLYECCECGKLMQLKSN